jgi:hypothetical protein
MLHFSRSLQVTGDKTNRKCCVMADAEIRADGIIREHPTEQSRTYIAKMTMRDFKTPHAFGHAFRHAPTNSVTKCVPKSVFKSVLKSVTKKKKEYCLQTHTVCGLQVYLWCDKALAIMLWLSVSASVNSWFIGIPSSSLSSLFPLNARHIVLVGDESAGYSVVRFTVVIYSCATCSVPCTSAADSGAHMRSHRGEAQKASTVALATPSKPFDEHGTAL